MKIDGVNDLRKLIKLCREQGIDSIKVDNIEIKLGDKPQKPTKETKAAPQPVFTPGGITEDTQIDSFDALTDEQKMFYSVMAEQQ